MTWDAATIEFQGASYPGFVAQAAFIVPDVPVGSYLLGETLNGVTGTGCHVFTPFEVVLPDTAMTRPASAGWAIAGWRAVVTALGLAAAVLPTHPEDC